jgi:hypothetical protein
MVAPRQRERLISPHPGNTPRLRRVQRPTRRRCRNIREQVLAPDFAVAGIGGDPRLVVASKSNPRALIASEAKPHSPAVAQTVGFGLGKSEIPYLSTVVD